MNPVDILVLTVIAVVILLAFRACFRRSKSGGSCCSGCECSSCHGCEKDNSSM